MLMATALKLRGDTGRRRFLYDAFAGMAEPTHEDYYLTDSRKATEMWKEGRIGEGSDWCRSPLEEVKGNLLSTGYPEENIIFVRGKAEDTIPGTTPDVISIARLDTDWYQSTWHELFHLFPLLAERGVLVIDDYGVMAGARKAVDEYMSENGVPVLLNRTDYTGRIGIK